MSGPLDGTSVWGMACVRGHEAAEYFGEYPVILVCLEYTIPEGIGRGKSERYIWEGGWFIDPLSFLWGPWPTPRKTGGLSSADIMEPRKVSECLEAHRSDCLVSIASGVALGMGWAQYRPDRGLADNEGL